MCEPCEKEPKIDTAKASTTEADPLAQSDHTLSTSPGTVRKKQRLGGERICRVCGDKAVAHNFDVISCESCKTFFRRNANRTQKECAFEGKCEITVQTRRFCPPCRLKKCFSVGMRSDMILDEVERKARMDKILTNRKKREEAAKKDNSDSSREPASGEPTGPNVCSPDSCTDSVQLTARLDLGSTPDAVDSLLSELAEFETQHPGLTTPQGNGQLPSQYHSLNRSGVHGAVSLEATPPDVSSSIARQKASDSGSQAPLFQHVPQSLLPSDPMMYWRLTSEEHKLITDLTVAYKEALLKMPESAEALTIQLETLSLQETLSHCDRFSFEIINFLKRVPDFKTLDIRDQQAVIKANAMMVLMLKSSACFSEEREAWLKDFGALPVDVFARMTQNEYVVTRYADFSRSLKRILKNDYSAYVLITCTVLFEPQVPSVLDRQKVNVLKDKYSTLLKHYLESQFSYVFASQYHDAVQASIVQGKALSSDMTLMFAGWKDYLRPLMLEIMNLR